MPKIVCVSAYQILNTIVRLSWSCFIAHGTTEELGTEGRIEVEAVIYRARS